MNEVALARILDMLNNLVDTIPPHPPSTTLFPDKWIAASALQKGIRRGNVKLALRALETLWNIDPRYARRRLAIVALEDVGLGAPDIVAVSVIACSGNKYLSKARIYPSVRACAIALARSPKERSAEHIYTILSYHGDFDLLRDRFAHKSSNQLIEIMIDPERFLLERSAAAWFLAGTNRFGGGEFPVVSGDMGAFEWAIEQLNTPPWQPLVTMAGLKISQCALPIFWPVKLSHQDCGGGKIIEMNKKTRNDTRNVPPYLLDQFTRGGKAVIRGILKEDTKLTRWLGGILPRKAWQATVEMGLFYLSSDVLDQEYVFRESEKLKDISVQADCCRAGLQSSDVNTLLEILTERLEEIENRCSAHIEQLGW